MNVDRINTAIISGNLTNDELTTVIDAVRYARAQLGKRSIRALSIGDNVNFNSTKLGRNVTGVVTKIAIKDVTVKTVAGLWKVPANMLTVVEDQPEFA
jgi:hypothetical protein